MKKNMKWLCVAIFCGLTTGQYSLASPLGNHASPYLRLHADDPVNWQPWGEEVLRRATRENRLILLSIGYFSCHWCHVMQRESYQNEQIAALLNERFVTVKVDRELRPELDRRMINFVENLTGQAGWPLNVFLTPDGYPVSGFTYLPKDLFLNALQKLDEQWVKRRPDIETAAKAYFEQTDQPMSRVRLMTLPNEHYTQLMDGFVRQAMQIADEMQGGFGDVAKFPAYPQMAALLEVIRLHAEVDPEVVRFVRLTLDKMLTGHLMDHLNGGFFRYVTDPDWQTPHFEKMLYDNALLARLYFDADQLWPDAGYAQAGMRTVEFMLEFLADESGGFYASLSAVDENNVEGGAYYWSHDRLEEILNREELATLQARSALSTEQSILIPQLDGSGIPAELAASIRRKLSAAARPRMPVDDKKLASWNALVLDALLLAEKHTTDPAFHAHADRLVEYIKRHFAQGGRMRRMANDPRAETTLEDYAVTARALQQYANARGDEAAANRALALVDRAFDDYFIDGLWRRVASSLIPGDRGQAVIQDDVLPSALTQLLETIESMPKANPGLQAMAQNLSARVTQDMFDLPYHYGSFIMHRVRQLAKGEPAE
jgi:uncharacterized protein YyaL (SSP411 family)